MVSEELPAATTCVTGCGTCTVTAAEDGQGYYPGEAEMTPLHFTETSGQRRHTQVEVPKIDETFKVFSALLEERKSELTRKLDGMYTSK